MKTLSFSPEPVRTRKPLFDSQKSRMRPVSRVHSFVSDFPFESNDSAFPSQRPKRATTACGPRKGNCIDLNSIPQVSSTPRRQKTFQKAPFITNPQHAAKKHTEIISSSEIEQIKKEINSMRRKAIQWGDSSQLMPAYCSIEPKEYEQPVKTHQRIIHDNEEIDINLPQKPVGLISTKGSVMDFLGLPTSVSYIR